jgi:adenylate kinase family enzyme
MVCNIFILGRTGSGKSTVARFLRELAGQEGWSYQSFNDYFFLREMFEKDTEQRFRATEHDGFEVLDRSVFPIAIRSLAQQVQSYCPAIDRTIITTEFTSNNYRDALQLFDAPLMRGAHFLFLSVDLKTCLERTGQRLLNSVTEDDYYVDDNVLLRHYSSPYMPLYINKEEVRFIDNLGSVDDLWNSILALAPILLGQMVSKYNPVLVEKPTLSIADRRDNLEITPRHLVVHK